MVKESALLRLAAAITCLFVAANLQAETLVSSAKILEVNERGMILMVGTEPLAVEDSADTKWWKDMASAKKDAFGVGDSVQVRVKTDSDPPQLKEISDAQTGKWLESIRKTARRGTIEKVDAKYLHFKFDDGTKFAYRITDKSDIKLSNVSNPTTNDLKPGMSLYIKGRLLPTLDTWVYEVSDTAPVVVASNSKSKSTAKPKVATKPIAVTGKLDGVILRHIVSVKMIDVRLPDRNLHIIYQHDTAFIYKGRAGSAADIQPGRRILATYKRDVAGRVICSRIEIRD